MTLYQARMRVQEINLRTDVSEQLKSMLFAQIISRLTGREFITTPEHLGDEFDHNF